MIGADEKHALVPVPRPTSNKVILLRVVNGVIIVFSIPYQLYNAPFCKTALDAFMEIFTENTIAKDVFSIGLTTVLCSASFLQDLLRLYPARTTEKTPPPKINYSKITSFLRGISILVYALDGTKDLQPEVWVFGDSKVALILIYGALGAVVLSAYVFYCWTLYDRRLIDSCNDLGNFFSGFKREFSRQPAVTIETLIMMGSLSLSKFIAAGAVLVQLWSGSPAGVVYFAMTATALINLLSRFTTVKLLNHNVAYCDLSARDFARVKFSGWDSFRFTMLALLRGGPFAALGKIVTGSWLGILIGIPFAAHLFYVTYKVELQRQALYKKLLRNAVLDSKEQNFELLKQRYDTRSLAIKVTIQNSLVNVAQICIAYGAGDLLFSAFGISLPKLILIIISLLLTGPTLAVSSANAGVDVTNTVKEVNAVAELQGPRGSLCSRWWKGFFWQSKEKLLANITEEQLQHCLGKVMVSTPMTPMSAVANHALPPPVLPATVTRERAASMSAAIVANYGTSGPLLPHVVTVAADVEPEQPRLTCSERFWKCLGW